MIQIMIFILHLELQAKCETQMFTRVFAKGILSEADTGRHLLSFKAIRATATQYKRHRYCKPPNRAYPGITKHIWRPRPFTGRMFKGVFLNSNVWNSITISQKFDTKIPIDTIPVLV